MKLGDIRGIEPARKVAFGGAIAVLRHSKTLGADHFSKLPAPRVHCRRAAVAGPKPCCATAKPHGADHFSKFPAPRAHCRTSPSEPARKVDFLSPLEKHLLETSLRQYLDLQQIRHQSQARQVNAIEQSFSEWQLEGDMLDEAQADVYKEEWLTLKVAWICCKVIGNSISNKNCVKKHSTKKHFDTFWLFHKLSV